MLSRLRTLGLSAALVIALGGLGYAGGTAVTPQAASADHVQGCDDSWCLQGVCGQRHNCSCVGTGSDGLVPTCDGTGPCTATANCGFGGGDGPILDPPGCDSTSVRCQLGCCD